MIDGHIHIEKGPYTLEWIQKFVDKAVEMELTEIRLLEHNYRFEEFVPMYDSVCAYSEYVDAWFHRNAGVYKLEDYLELIRKVYWAAFILWMILPLTINRSIGTELMWTRFTADILKILFCWQKVESLMASVIRTLLSCLDTSRLFL